MLKPARLLIVPVLMLAAMRPSFAQTTTAELLAQPPEKLAALKNDPHIAKAMKFLEVSDSRADVLKKADGVLDAVVLSEQHEHPRPECAVLERLSRPGARPDPGRDR